MFFRFNIRRIMDGFSGIFGCLFADPYRIQKASVLLHLQTVNNLEIQACINITEI